LADSVDSRYQRYYAEKLWEMIPAVYRNEDAKDPNPGVLRALVEVVARQFAAARRNSDRLWEDQFIEFCSDRAVPFIADLVGTRLVSVHNPQARRVDVAKTVYYRRGKGTLRVLEELVADITGWDGIVVEGFRRLARVRHGMDRKPGSEAGALTGTLSGGWADLRDPHGAELAGKPFDEYFHTPDMRQHCGTRGRYAIPKLLFHVFRLEVCHVHGGTAARVIRDDQEMFTFDPTGREIPLYSPRARQVYGAFDWSRQGSTVGHQRQWHPAAERELPAPLTRFRLAREMAASAQAGHTGVQPWGDWLQVCEGPDGTDPVPAASVAVRELPCQAVFTPDVRLVVDPQRGVFQFVGQPPVGPVEVTYHHAVPGPIGVGAYQRAQDAAAAPESEEKKVEELNLNALPATGAIVVSGSGRCNAGPDAETAVADLSIRAQKDARPYIDVGDGWTITGQGSGTDARIELNGLWIGGVAMKLVGDFETVRLSHVTLDPGGAGVPSLRLEVDGFVENLLVESSVVGRIAVGSVGKLERLEIADSVVQSTEPDEPAICTDGTVDLTRTTVLGAIKCDELQASEALLVGAADVANTQSGCFRFSAALGRVLFSVEGSRAGTLDGEQAGDDLRAEFQAHGFALSAKTMVWVQELGRTWLVADIEGRRSYSIVNSGTMLDVYAGFRLPRPYESHFYPDSVRFLACRDYGQPGYARISQLAPEDIRRGAESGSEIGTFCSLVEPLKLDDLRAKLDECMPFGLVPVIITET